MLRRRYAFLVLCLAAACATQQAPPATRPSQPPAPSTTSQSQPAAQPAAQQPPQPAPTLPAQLKPGAVGALPNSDGSLKFLVIGDMGTGDKPQYDVAGQMVTLHAQWKFTDVVMVGDNMYGSQRPNDYERKFRLPYASLLKDGVNFHAALGNHDEREQREYKLFNMDGKSYYTWKPKEEDVRFFFLESDYPNEAQLKWMQTELSGAKEKWKIALFHHPLYSSGGRHGPNIPLRKAWEPLFLQHNVSVVFTGHEHFYERIKPQQGIQHFIVGSSGKLAAGDLNDRSSLTAAGFDRDNVFLAVEIDDDVMFFQAYTRTGRIVDSGTFTRRFRPDEKK